MPRHNFHFPVANPATLLTGTQYLPNIGNFANPCFQELRLFIRRITAGSGTLDITLQEYDPNLNLYFDARGGGGAVVGAIQYGAGAGDAAGARHVLRIGHGILGGAATGVLVVNTIDNWVDYTVPEYWRLKLVESATGSVVGIGAQYLRGL